MHFKAVFVLLFFKGCFDCLIVNASEFMPSKHYGNTSSEKKFSQKKTPGFRIRLPFMDMEIENQRNLFIMQEKTKEEDMFLLHGSELYQMFVDRQEKRLSLVGCFGGTVKDMEPLGGEVVLWHDYLLVVIAMDEHLEVYQLSRSLLKMRADIMKELRESTEKSPTFEPIQQLSLPGRYKQHFLTDPDKERIMLIVGINFTKLYGRLSTFLWSNTYFEPIEELTVSPLHMLHILGTYPKYLVRGRIIQHQTKTIITAYKVQIPSMTLHTTQTFTLNSRIIHASSFRNKNYLIACSSQQKQCHSFRMGSDALFSIYKQRSSQDMAFDKFVGGKNFLVAARRNQVFVYTSGRLDCYASFSTNETDITSILTLVNSHGESFVLLNYKRPLNMLIRFVELESETGDLLGATGLNVTEIEDTNTLFRHRHMFEETIGMLRSLLLRRRNAMNTFRRSADKQKPERLELEITHPVRIHGGNINVIKVVGRNLLSPVQVLHRIAAMRQKFGLRRRKRETWNERTAESIVPTRLKVKHLKVSNLVYDGTILEGFYLDKAAQPLPILSVRPTVVAKSLYTNKMLARQKLKHARSIEVSNSTTQPVLKFKAINVESINNVSWQEFYDSLLLKNRDRKIQGSLVLQAPSKIEHLNTTMLNKLVVANIFNLELPQVIRSNLLFYGFFTTNLTANTVNGLDFANDMVFQNSDDLIDTPVNMYYLNITKDLLLDENATIVRTPNEEESQFQQFYSGKVIINGSLTVTNLGTEAAGRVLINGVPFSKAYVKERFLLGNQAQDFNSTVIFGNAKVTMPSLSTNFLNDNPTEEHLFSNGPNEVKKPLLLVFMNAHIEGNLDSKTITMRIPTLSRNVVRRGEVANITGVKIFVGPLSVDHVMTLSLNKLPVTDLVLKTQLKHDFQFDDTKYFNEVWVGGNVIVNEALNATNLNKLSVDDLLNNDYHIQKLKVPYRLQAKNIVFHKINDIHFDEVFKNFKLRDGELILHKELIIDGNVTFGDVLVEYINGIHWNTYQTDLVRRNENAVILGRKCFQEELTITNALESPLMNGMKLEQIFEKILSKSKPQIIEGAYTFENLKLTNLDVDVINEIPTAEFVDIRSKKVIINGNLIVPKIVVLGNVSTIDEHDLFNLRGINVQIKKLPNQIWRNIVVTKNATWQRTGNVDKSQWELLTYLQQKAVQRTGQQVITGNVRLRRPLITNMKTKSAFPPEIDFDYLATDCVLKNTYETQAISAEKTFLKLVTLQNVATKSFLGTYLVNGINIQQLNRSLYYLSDNEHIKGPIFFKTPPKIGHFIVEGHVNGIDPVIIYCNETEAVPPIKLSKLVVRNALEIGDINGNCLENLLQKRIRKNDAEALNIPGTLSFENLVLDKKVKVQRVNGIPIDKIVFKQSKELQAITAAKTVHGDVIFAGPAHVVLLNDEDLIESYQQSIFINRNYHYDKLRIDGATFEKGLIFTQLANPLLAATVQDSTNRDVIQKYKTIEHELDEVEKVLNSKTQHLLYLDYAANWSISWQPDNLTTHKSFTYELTKSTPCARRFLNVQLSKPNLKSMVGGAIFLSNTTTNFITTFAHNISVKAENYCHHKYRKVKCKITISGANFTRVIGMKKYIENIIIYSPSNQGAVFVLLHALDFSRNQNEVRVLRVVNTQTYNITDWQSLTMGIGKTLRLFEYNDFTALISGGGTLKKHPSLAVYHFAITQKFLPVQFIDGDFDIHELLPTKSDKDFQLILSCRQCQRVHIYSYDPKRVSSPYQIFQIIKLKTLIDSVKPFRVNDGSIYLLFLMENGQDYFYLYRFTQLQGWLYATYGYLENTVMAVPLFGDELDLDETNLLALFCSVNNCNLVRAVVV